MKKFQGVIAVFIGALSFGILSTFVKKAYEENFTLAEVTGIQALFGMLILWAGYFLTTLFVPATKERYARKTPFYYILISGVSSGAVSILYYKCVQLIPASLAIVLLMQYIWISIVIELLLFKVKPSKKQVFGIACILLCTILATGLMESNLTQIPVVGIVFGFLAAIAYSIFIIVNGRVGNDYPPIQKSALMVTGAFLLICILLQPLSIFNPETLQALWKYGLLLAVFGTMLPPLLFAYGMPKIGVSLGSILIAVELPVAVCFSYFVLHEQVSNLQFTGVVLILIVISWLNSNMKKQVN